MVNQSWGDLLFVGYNRTNLEASCYVGPLSRVGSYEQDLHLRRLIPLPSRRDNSTRVTLERYFNGLRP